MSSGDADIGGVARRRLRRPPGKACDREIGGERQEIRDPQ
eukprot:gene18954-22894_t